jgi:hypothetical protein
VELVNGAAEGVPFQPGNTSQTSGGKGESTLTIYGFAMLDAGYQSNKTILIG